MNCPQPRFRSPLTRLLCALLLAAASAAVSEAGVGASSPPDTGLVRRIVPAPVVPDGLVAGRPTDFVIDLDTALDPNVPGRALRAGGTIEVTLPDAFTRDPGVPFRTLFSDPSCMPSTVTCNTVILLQGWPQHPVGFPPPNMPNLWTVAFDAATNTVVVTALQDLPARPPSEPGIKQLHLLLAGFTNPRPGLYRVGVITETGPNGAPETGWGRLRVRPRVRSSLAIAGSFNPGAPNTLYQTTTPGSPTPLPYDLLVWDEGGAPLLNVTARQISPDLAVLVEGERAVGLVTIDAPSGASGQQVTTPTPSFAVSSPVIGVPTARLTVFFTAGEVPGEYVLRFRLFGGNALRTIVVAR